MKKILSKCIVINLFLLLNIFSDIPECSLIKTNNGIKPIEKFSIYEKVISYNGGQFKDVSIKSIAKYKSKDFVAVQTSSGILCAGTEAKIFSVSKNKFVKSTDLDVTDTLLSFDLKEYPIQKVVICESDEENNFFIFSLEVPHTFFMCDSKGTPFLMHNNPAVFILEYVIERSPEILGFVIDKAPEIIEIGVSSVLALFGAKIAHNNSKHRSVLDEQRKAEIRQKHIESLQDKVRLGKATHEDYETLHLLEDYPEISYEELNRRIEENRKYREANRPENLIKNLGKDGYEQLIKFYLLKNKINQEQINNSNLNNDVSTEQEKQPPVISDEDEDNESDDKNNNQPPKAPKNPKFRDMDARRHTFQKKENHLPEDTPENEKIIVETVKDEYYDTTDKHGNDWYSRIMENGKQIWVRTRNGMITDGGVNSRIIESNNETGLCKLIKS